MRKSLLLVVQDEARLKLWTEQIPRLQIYRNSSRQCHRTFKIRWIHLLKKLLREVLRTILVYCKFGTLLARNWKLTLLVTFSRMATT